MILIRFLILLLLFICSNLPTLAQNEKDDLVYYDSPKEFRSPYEKRQEVKKIYDIAVNRYNQQEYEIALELLDQAISLQPDFVDAYFQRAAAAERLLMYEDALVDYEILIHLADSMNEAFFGKARTLYHLERYVDALDVFDHLMKLPSGSTNAVYFKTANYASNQSAVVGVTTLQSNQADLYNYKGLCHLELEQWQSALAAFEIALKQSPHNPDYLLNKALCLKNSGHTKQAMEELSLLLQHNPDHELAWYNLAVLAEDTGNIPEKLNQLNNSLGSATKIPSAYLNRGIIKYKAQDYSGALADFDSALILKPNDHDFLINRAMALEKMKYYQRAIDDLDQVLQKNDKNAQAYKLKGDIFFRTDDFQAAAANYTMAISYKPYNPSALYNRGLSFLKIKEWTKGCMDLRKSYDYGYEAAQKLMIKYCR